MATKSKKFKRKNDAKPVTKGEKILKTFLAKVSEQKTLNQQEIASDWDDCFSQHSQSVYFHDHKTKSSS